MLFDPLEVQLAADEPPTLVRLPVDVAVADEPDHIGPVPDAGRRCMVSDAVDVSGGQAAVDDIPVVGHLMEGAVVDPEAVGDPAQGVVSLAGDDRLETVGEIGDHQLAVGHEQTGQPLAVPVVDGGTVVRRQIAERTDGGLTVGRPEGTGHGRSGPPRSPGRHGEPLGEGRHLVVDPGQVVAHRGRDDQAGGTGRPGVLDLLLRGGGQVTGQGELDAGRIATGFLGRDPHLGHPEGQVLGRQAEGLEPVAETSGPSGRRLAVPPDVDGHPVRPGRLGVRVGMPEREELALEVGARRPRVGPQSAHGGDRLVGTTAPGPRIGSGGPELLVHPPHPDAHPYPASRQDVDGGDPLGQDHRMMVGEDQHAGGQSDAVGDGGQVGHQIERIGDPAVVGQRHLPRGGVGIDALVVGDHDRVFHQDHRFEPAGLGVAGERGHPLGVGGDPRSDWGDDPEPHGLAHFRQCPAAACSERCARRAGVGSTPLPGDRSLM